MTDDVPRSYLTGTTAESMTDDMLKCCLTSWTMGNFDDQKPPYLMTEKVMKNDKYRWLMKQLIGFSIVRDWHDLSLTMATSVTADDLADWKDHDLAYLRAHVDKEEATDPSIYIRVWREHDEAFDWYNLYNKYRINNFSVWLEPCFPRRPKEHRYSSCVSMGSKIFVVGGGGILAPFPKPSKYAIEEEAKEKYNDVWFINTCRSSNLNQGWIEGRPLQQARANPVLACFGGKLYVISASYLWEKPLDLFVEVLEDNQSWRPLHYYDYDYDKYGFPSLEYCLVDIDYDTERILLHQRFTTRLYSYDVHKNSVEVLSDQIGTNSYASAIVDGIMYSLDGRNPGQFIGFDISKHGCSEIIVEFSDPTRYSFLPRPHPHCRTGPLPCRTGPLPDHFLVALGNQRLAVVWAEIEGERKLLNLFCSKWKMAKVQVTDKIIKLVACQKSVKQYMVGGGHGILESCLVVGQNSSGTSGEMAVETIDG